MSIKLTFIQVLLERILTTISNQARSSNMESTDSPCFPVKGRICMFCATGIVSGSLDSADKAEAPCAEKACVSLEGFLKGISVLCKILQIESSKFTSEERWNLSGDFVSLVCCGTCGLSLDKLVTLNQLLVETQTCLEQNVRKMEHSIVKSTKGADDVEYSIRACLEFREEVIRNYGKRLEFITVNDGVDEEDRSRGYDVVHGLQEDQECFSPSKDNCSSHSKALIKSHNTRYKRTCDSIDETPAAIDPPIPRKRSRPRKHFGQNVPIANKSVLEMHFLDASMDESGKDNENESVSNIEIDNGVQSSEDDEYKPSISRSSSNSSTEEDSTLSQDEDYTLKKSERNRRHPRETKADGEGQQGKFPNSNFKPIYEVDESSGIYMFLNVKIQKVATSLLCKHTGCHFHADKMEYFRDQDVFAEIRQHIRGIHRSEESKGEGNTSQYYCWLCDSSKSSKICLLSHLRSHHKNFKYPLTLCEICGKSLPQKRIAEHRLSHQNEEESAIQSKYKRSRPDLKLKFLSSSNKTISSSLTNIAKKKGKRTSKKGSEKEGKKTPRRKMSSEIRTKRTSSPGCNFRPLFVVNQATGIYMYLYVKIQREFNAFSCKFPGCDFVSERMEYFYDQDIIRTVMQHVREVHRDLNNERTKYILGLPYYCWHCDTYIKKRTLYRAHIKECHPNEKKHYSQTMCDICGCIVPQRDIAQHRLTHQSELEKSNFPKAPRISKQVEKSSFACDECDKVFKYQFSLRKHKKSHIPLEMRSHFTCHICGKKLTSAVTLKDHVEVIHFRDRLEDRYICLICNRGFKRTEKTSFDAHVRCHTGERPYQCDQCGKAFSTTNELRKHEELHLDVKISCEFCGNSYSSKRCLQRHQTRAHLDLISTPTRHSKRTITEADPDFIGPKLAHPCEPCGKVYRFKSQLVVHMKQAHKLILPKYEDYPSQNIIR